MGLSVIVIDCQDCRDHRGWRGCQTRPGQAKPAPSRRLFAVRCVADTAGRVGPWTTESMWVSCGQVDEGKHKWNRGRTSSRQVDGRMVVWMRVDAAQIQSVHTKVGQNCQSRKMEKKRNGAVAWLLTLLYSALRGGRNGKGRARQGRRGTIQPWEAGTKCSFPKAAGQAAAIQTSGSATIWVPVSCMLCHSLTV